MSYFSYQNHERKDSTDSNYSTENDSIYDVPNDLTLGRSTSMSNLSFQSKRQQKLKQTKEYLVLHGFDNTIINKLNIH